MYNYIDEKLKRIDVEEWKAFLLLNHSLLAIHCHSVPVKDEEEFHE